jgi:hypothetical protein
MATGRHFLAVLGGSLAELNATNLIELKEKMEDGKRVVA